MLFITQMAVRLSVGCVLRGDVTGDATGVVFVAPPSAGNLGDQAMLDSFCQNSSVRPTVVYDSRSGFSKTRSDVAGEVMLRGVHSGSIRRQVAAMRAIAKLAGKGGALAVAGADIIDGVYHARSVVALWTLLETAQRRGVECRVVGFSWSPRVLPAVQRAAVRAADAGVSLIARDAISRDRMLELGVAPVTSAADMVFMRRPQVDEVPPLFVSEAPFAIVNMNPVVSASDVQMDRYISVLSLLRSRGLEVILLPNAAADIVGHERLRQRAEATGVDQIWSVSKLPTVDEVLNLCARATITVTGRMHLAILSLTSGTPAVAVSYQGKVAGMMAMMGTPERCVEPSDLSSVVTLELVSRILELSLAGDRVDVSRARALAMLNFSGFPRGANR
ncbi:polysaccharide pyruvyl transferase family protein [Flavimobilis soli]|nr:polysaccharide pyruvyl transferase family protein [Flavimobilis soli]